MKTDMTERAVYSAICSSDGLKAREIARVTGIERETVNRHLYGSPFMRELCWRDREFRWHGFIRQARPHKGLEDFCGFYSTVREFLSLGEKAWFERLCEGCSRVGRSLNDTRGLFHSFLDSRRVMEELFEALDDVGFTSYGDWEICFEVRIKRSGRIRIYADVLLITEDRVFSLEFKMKDAPEDGEVEQAAKYCPWLEVVFGPKYDVIPALVLTRAADQYGTAPIGRTDAFLPVCSGDMLFNLLDEYVGVIR